MLTVGGILVIPLISWGVRGGVYTQSDNQNMKYQEGGNGGGLEGDNLANFILEP